MNRAGPLTTRAELDAALACALAGLLLRSLRDDLAREAAAARAGADAIPADSPAPADPKAAA